MLNPQPRRGYHVAMDAKQIEQRLVAIEEKIAFFEKYATDLNDAVLDLAKQVNGMRSDLKRAETRFDEALAKIETSSDPADEKPPHY